VSRLAEVDATTVASLVRRGERSAEAAVRACLARISALESRIHAFHEVAPAEDVLSEARRCGALAGALRGVPVAVKEIFDVRGMHCGWGTPIHRTRVPDHDAVAVARLRGAGAVIVGTTVSTEYAIGTAGPTTNPHDASRTPGGSSSGSAAAVAARMVPVALGSLETGGLSIEAIPTPGHSADMICFVVDGRAVFSGDTLFMDAVGGGDFGQIKAAVMDIYMEMPHDRRVLPGHTDETTIGREWERNPFIRVWRGVEPEGTEQVRVNGRAATLVVWSPDYDDRGKAWVRFDDGADAIVGGSRVERS